MSNSKSWPGAPVKVAAVVGYNMDERFSHARKP